MKKAKALIAAALCLALCLTAYAEPAFVTLIDTAEKLAYHTENVTIEGKAVFSLDGERFKTAEITYVQDGENSFWQEKLYTPREWRPDLVSGFTVIANGDDIYAIDALKPRGYRSGFDAAQSTLLRKTQRSDLLFALARTAAAQLSPVFDARVSQTETEAGGRTYQLALQEGEAPQLLNLMALLSMRLLGRRMFEDYDEDDSIIQLADSDYHDHTIFSTARQRILYDTEALALGETSVAVSLDGQGRLTAVSGTLNAGLTDYLGEKRLLTVDFEAALSRYGTSHVNAFDPEEYHVVPYWQAEEEELAGKKPEKKLSLSDDQLASLTERARTLARAAGYKAEEMTSVSEDDGRFYFRFDETEDQQDFCVVTLTEDGLCPELSEYFDIDRTDEKSEENLLTDEMKEKIMAFLRLAAPALADGVRDLTGDWQYRDGDVWEINVHAPDENGDEGLPELIIRVLPEWKILKYSCLGNG